MSKINNHGEATDGIYSTTNNILMKRRRQYIHLLLLRRPMPRTLRLVVIPKPQLETPARATGSAKTRQNGDPSRHTPISDSNTPIGTDARPRNSPYSNTTPFPPFNRVPPLVKQNSDPFTKFTSIFPLHGRIIQRPPVHLNI